MLIVYSTGLFLTCYLLLATLLRYISGVSDFTTAEYAWPALLLVTLLFFLKDIKILSSFSMDAVRRHLDTVFIFLLLFMARLFSVNEVSIWLDEHIQALYSVAFLPVAAGAIQHQPPGDMVLTHLGLWLSGMSVWGLRLHAALFSALAAAGLYGFTKSLSGSRLFGMLCMLFFSYHHIVYKYGYEARPVSFGLFLEVMFIGALLLQIKYISESRKIQYSTFLSGITILYLCSLGMQPAFVVGLSIAFFAALTCFKREYLKLTGQIALGLALFLPLQFFIVKLAPARFNLTNGFDFFRTLSELKFSNFAVLNLYYNPLGYLSLLLLFAGLLYRKRKPFEPVVAFLGFLTIFFPLSLISFFKAHVEWELNNYYIISCLPLLFLLLSALWGRLSLNANKKTLLSSLLTVCLFAAMAGTYNYKDRNGVMLNEHQDLKSAYKAVQEDMKKDDLLLSFCLNSEGFCVQWLIARPFYLPGSHDLAKAHSVEVYQRALTAGTIGEHIFFLYQGEWSLPDPGTDKLFARFNMVSVYKLPANNNPAGAVIEFLQPLVSAALKKNVLYPEALAYLIVSYGHLGNKQKKSELLSIYKDKKTPATPENHYLDGLFKDQTTR